MCISENIWILVVHIPGNINKQISQNTCKQLRSCLSLPKIGFAIYCATSQTGWGATDGNNPTRGKLLETQEYHINDLEFKAFFLAVRAYERY